MSMTRLAAISLLTLTALSPLLPAAAAQEASDGAATFADAATLDLLWVFLAAVLVFLMQGGFALLGAGAVRAKNTVNYLMKSVMDFSLGALVFFAVGFAFMFGTGNAYLGWTNFGLAGATDPASLIFFLFQVMFAATAATIVAGAVAERMKLGAYVVYTIAITAFIYPVFGHWVWGGGFLAELGMVDFAGSGVVHGVGGLLALVAAAVLGPRLGRYGADGKPRAMPGHNQVYIVLGTLLLFFGWFGFNAGSTLSASDPGVALIAVNTFLAGAAGATAVFVAQLISGPQDLGRVCNGMLGGLVAVTAPCAFIAPWAALVVGGIGGLTYLGGAALLERIRIDDPVGAIPVHGFCGLFGVIAVGIFADGTGGVTGLVGGEVEQLLAQLAGAGVLLAWTLGTGFILFKGLDLVMGLRIGSKEEQTGLDEFHHGGSAYPELTAVLGVFRK
ncbi:MAG: ammonium transporter [Thermoplasmatota archaeon]